MRSIYPFAALFLVSSALASCSPAVEDLHREADTAIERHDYVAARLALLEAVKADPLNPALLEKMVRTEVNLGSGESALRYLDQLEGTGSVPADIKLVKAEALVLAGKHTEALDLLSKEEVAEAYRIKASALSGKGKQGEALAMLQAGLGATGNRVKLYSDYALVLLSLGNLEEARTYAVKASKLGPTAVEPMIAQGRISESVGDWARALGFFETASSKFPDSKAALLGKVRMLGELGRLDEAEPLIRDTYAKLSGDLEVVFLMAKLETELGNTARARDILQLSESKIADFPPAQLLYADVLMEQGQKELAYRMLFQLNLRYPEQAEVATKLARLTLERGDKAGARDLVKPLIDRGIAPQESIAVYNASQ